MIGNNDQFASHSHNGAIRHCFGQIVIGQTLVKAYCAYTHDNLIRKMLMPIIINNPAITVTYDIQCIRITCNMTC